MVSAGDIFCSDSVAYRFDGTNWVELSSSTPWCDSTNRKYCSFPRGTKFILQEYFSVNKSQKLTSAYLKLRGDSANSTIIRLYDQSTGEMLYEYWESEVDTSGYVLWVNLSTVERNKPMEFGPGNYILEFVFREAGAFDWYYFSGTSSGKYNCGGAGETNIPGELAIVLEFAEEYEMVDHQYFLDNAPEYIDFNSIQHSDGILRDQWYEYNNTIRYTSEMTEDGSVWTVNIPIEERQNVQYHYSQRPDNPVSEAPKRIVDAAIASLPVLTDVTVEVTDIDQTTSAIAGEQFIVVEVWFKNVGAITGDIYLKLVKGVFSNSPEIVGESTANNAEPGQLKSVYYMDTAPNQDTTITYGLKLWTESENEPQF